MSQESVNQIKNEQLKIMQLETNAKALKKENQQLCDTVTQLQNKNKHLEDHLKGVCVLIQKVGMTFDYRKEILIYKEEMRSHRDNLIYNLSKIQDNQEDIRTISDELEIVNAILTNTQEISGLVKAATTVHSIQDKLSPKPVVVNNLSNFVKSQQNSLITSTFKIKPTSRVKSLSNQFESGATNKTTLPHNTTFTTHEPVD
jgi:predicted RNase H-like nuclease (RuvC/YqgF family)